MADSTLSKLLSVDSDLVAQEAELTAQLEAIQAKRASLLTVMERFDGGQPPPPDMEEVNAPIAAIAAVVPTASSTEASTKAAARRKGAKGNG